VRVSRFVRGGAVVAATAGLVMSTVLPAVAATSAAGAAPPVITITATPPSPLKAVTGSVWVTYHAGKLGMATLSGTITNVTAGEDARLFAQPFPFKKPPVALRHEVLGSPGTNNYKFIVMPGIETRYTVKLFSSSSATTPVPGVVAAHKPVFIVPGGSSNGPQKCKRPVCHESFRLHIVLPASALQRESVKHWFVYLGVHLTTVPRRIPSAPTVLKLDTKATATKAARLAPGAYRVTLKFSFRIGNDGFSWGWTACTRDSEPADGIGLPGHHDCGNKQISTKLFYLG
jgi:hypothetical protein